LGPRAALLMRLFSSFPAAARSREMIEYSAMVIWLCWGDPQFGNAVMKVLFEVIADPALDDLYLNVARCSLEAPHLAALPWTTFDRMRHAWGVRLQHCFKSVTYNSEVDPEARQARAATTFADCYTPQCIAGLVARNTPTVTEIAARVEKRICDSSSQAAGGSVLSSDALAILRHGGA
jgi:hypothetical protein